MATEVTPIDRERAACENDTIVSSTGTKGIDTRVAADQHSA